MNEIQRFQNRFSTGIQYFRMRTGKLPTVCIMGSTEMVAWEFIAKQECTVTDTSMEKKRSWMNVTLFTGEHETGMVFGMAQ